MLTVRRNASSGFLQRWSTNAGRVLLSNKLCAYRFNYCVVLFSLCFYLEKRKNKSHVNLNRLRVFEKQISNSLQKAMKKNTSLQPLLYKIIFPSLCRALHSVLVAADFTSGKPVPVYSARNLISLSHWSQDILRWVYCISASAESQYNYWSATMNLA